MSSKVNAQLRNATGNVQETVGNVLGSESMQRSGYENQAQADAQMNESKVKGYAEGTGDRVQGKFESVTGAVTNDKSQQHKGNVRQDKGDAQQEFNRRV